MQKKVMTKKRSSAFWSEKVHPPPQRKSRLRLYDSYACLYASAGRRNLVNSIAPEPLKDLNQNLHVCTSRSRATNWLRSEVTSHRREQMQRLPSTSDVSSVTVAALRLPAGRFSPIFSSLSLSARPPFFDLALITTPDVITTVQGKKVAPTTTFVDISATRKDFCMKFYATIKRSNIHFITKFG